jgi:hypothetical protein
VQNFGDLVEVERILENVMLRSFPRRVMFAASRQA